MRPTTGSRRAEARPAWREHLGYALLALFFAFAQMRFLLTLFARTFLRSSQVAEGVLAGESYWRFYQSRVLAPFLVGLLKPWTGSFAAANVLFCLLCLALAGYGVLALGARLRDPRRPPLAAFLLLQLAFLLLVLGNWIYPWDFLALPLFVAFNYLVLSGVRAAWLAALYAVAVFNHEIAFFIPAWLVLDPVFRFAARGRGAPAAPAVFDWRKALLGAGLLAGGIALVEWLRAALLVREVAHPADLPGLVVYGGSFHVTLAENLRAVRGSFGMGVAAGFPFVVPLFLVAVAALAVALARSEWTRCAALSAVTIGMIGSFLCFGLLLETRVYTPLVPFVAMNAWAVLVGRAAPATPARASGT